MICLFNGISERFRGQTASICLILTIVLSINTQHHHHRHNGDMRASRKNSPVPKKKCFADKWWLNWYTCMSAGAHYLCLTLPLYLSYTSHPIVHWSKNSAEYVPFVLQSIIIERALIRMPIHKINQKQILIRCSIYWTVLHSIEHFKLSFFNLFVYASVVCHTDIALNLLSLHHLCSHRLFYFIWIIKVQSSKYNTQKVSRVMVTQSIWIWYLYDEKRIVFFTLVIRAFSFILSFSLFLFSSFPLTLSFVRLFFPPKAVNPQHSCKTFVWSGICSSFECQFLNNKMLIFNW